MPTPLVRRLTLVAAAVALGLTALARPAAAVDRPNLYVTSMTTQVYSSADGALVKVVAVVKNTGKKGAGGSYTGLYLSRDTKISSTDVRLDREVTKALPKGATTTKFLAGRLPATVAAGTWRLIVCADTSGQVKESSETNCRTWKTFTRAAPPVVTEGPNGGAASVCSGALQRAPYSNGTYAQPLQGVHFTATPTTSGFIPFDSPGVGVEWDYLAEDTPPYQVVTITNDGTQPVSGISDIQTDPCQLDSAQPDHWGSFDSVIRAGDGQPYPDVQLVDPCGSTLAAGASCQVLVTMTEATTRGGTALPGYLRISVQVAGTAQNDVVAYFPIGVGSTSQGYWGGFTQQPGSDSFSNVPAGTRRYAYYTVTNIGDRDALPVFRVEEEVGTPVGGIRVDSPDGWSAPAGYPTKCATVLYDAVNDVYSPATAPGGSCTVRVSACSVQGSRNWSAAVVARHPATEAQRSSRYDVTFSTSPGDGGTC